MEPVLIKLKEDSKSYHGHCYKILKAYEHPTSTEIDRLVAIEILHKLSYDNNLVWESLMLTQSKKTGNI